ncbi:phenylalanine--tRNA ligase subunit beta [Candidatus Berkelbacteria bacterium]|nr:phenylalanine--tRNA ligase subunit beta [Candidatus Berkelbacteria bacterium]
MKLVLDWLREYVKFDDSAEQLAELYTGLGIGAEPVGNGVLDLEITPNRGDCLSHLGLAREYSAARNRPLNLKRYDYQFAEQSKLVKVKDTTGACTRYVAAVFRGVKIKQSPEYIKEKLEAYGIKPHNNIIDITNLVMAETGQPLHAFDLAKINGKTMTIRHAKKGEELKLLNTETLKLSPDNLVIADKDRVIDLLGIMGGANSSISNITKDVLLQAAALEPKLIRKSSKVAGVRSEASHRYERSVDFAGAPYGLSVASKLIEQEGNAPPQELFDLVFKPLRARNIELKFDSVPQLLGTPIDSKLIRNYLIRLGFVLVSQTAKSLIVKVPSFRMADVMGEHDLIEEIARLHGYGRLTRKLIERRPIKTNNEYHARRALVAKLSAAGFNQIESYSLIDPKTAQALGIAQKQLVTLANPLSPETSALRPALTIGLLKTAQRNAWWPQIKLFEIGNVFSTTGQQLNVAIAASPSFSKDDKKMLAGLTVTKFDTSHPLGKLIKLRQPLEVVETSVDDLIKKLDISPDIPTEMSRVGGPTSRRPYRPISNFPPVVRDIAIIVDETLEPTEVIKTITGVDKKVLVVELFDEFVSPKFGGHKKSLAFRIILDDPEKTMELITTTLVEQFSATVR